MDRVGARNALIVLLSLVGLTTASFAVLLYQVVVGEDVPDLLLGLVTSLSGLLFGSQINTGAPPRVDAAAKAATVNAAAGSTVNVSDGTDPAALAADSDYGAGDVRPESPAAVQSDADDPLTPAVDPLAHGGEHIEDDVTRL